MLIGLVCVYNRSERLPDICEIGHAPQRLNYVDAFLEGAVLLTATTRDPGLNQDGIFYKVKKNIGLKYLYKCYEQPRNHQ